MLNNIQNIKVIEFNSFKEGKNLLVLGAIHGNETCGTEAIKDIIYKIDNNEIVLNSGSITFIPVCNLNAYKNNVRFMEVNLNRVIKNNDNPVFYEEKIANVLTKYIDKCNYMLDLHSMHENGNPFCFQDYLGKENENFAKIQGLDYIFQGWPEIYKNSNIPEYSTQTYAKSKNKIATTVECGSHTDDKSIEIAKQCIINSLNYLNIINTTKLKEKTHKNILMQKVIIKESEGKINNFHHLDTVKKGDIIASYVNGKQIIADDNYIIIFPYDAKIGQEWFYLGKMNN